MTERQHFPLVDEARLSTLPMPSSLGDGAGEANTALIAPPTDRLNRPLTDLRLSVTDRCNFRCSYCMPRHVFGKNHPFLPRNEILSFEEILRTIAVLVPMGLQKIRLTGGEPLLRQNFPNLLSSINTLIRNAPNKVDVTLTTNGSLLAKQLPALIDAGLQRITVSLDAINAPVFMRMNDADYALDTVLEGIDDALSAGLSVKINMVVLRGINEGEVLPMIDFVRKHLSPANNPAILRFIEFMDVGNTNAWQPHKVVRADELLRLIASHYRINPLPTQYRGEVARRYSLDEVQEIGMIASVSAPFCGDCTRLRLSANGQLFTCLFAEQGYDWRALLRSGVEDSALDQSLRLLWQQRADRYSELRLEKSQSNKKIEMSFIGG